MKHTRIKAIVTLIIIIGLAGYVYTVAGRPTDDQQVQTSARQIPPDTYFSEVRQLSVGTKPACLAEDPALAGILEQDDTLGYDASFGSRVTSAIPDMPAGLVDMHLATSSDTKVTGHIVFSDKNQSAVVGNLRDFNYAVSRSAADKPWKLTSFIACQPQ